MKTLSSIYLLVLLVLANISPGQGGWKKYYYPSAGFTSVSRGIVESPGGGFIAVGFTADTLFNNIYNKLTLIGTDNNGNLLWKKYYGGVNFSYLSNTFAPSAAIYKENNAFYYTVGIRDSVNEFQGVLVKFDYNGDTLWQRILRDSSEDVIPQGITKSVDGGFLITGGFQNWTTNATPCMILKTDHNGNELWRKKIYNTSPDFNLGNGIVQDSGTKRIIITGFLEVAGKSYMNLVIADSLGNIILHQALNNAGGGGALDLIQLRDKNFLTCGAYTDHWNSTDSYVNCYVVKFDKTGSVIWSKTYFYPAIQNSFRFVKELENGDLVLTRVFQDSNLVQACCFPVKVVLVKLNNQGVMLSYRYVGLDKENIIDEEATNLSKTSTGGFILTSEFPYKQNPRPFSIIKIDSTFCDTTAGWCQSEALGIESFNFKSGYTFEMHPNPADKSVNLKVEISQENPLGVIIRDVSGREVEVLQLKVNEEFEINTNSYQAGLYFVDLIYRGQIADTKKLIIMR